MSEVDQPKMLLLSSLVPIVPAELQFQILCVWQIAQTLTKATIGHVPGGALSTTV